MAWNPAVPTSATTPSGSCAQFQDNWAALETWVEVEHVSLSASADVGTHLLTRDKAFTFVVTEALSIGPKKCTSFVVPFTCTIEKAWAYVQTAPSGAAIIIDINLNDSSIWPTQGDRLSIASEGSTASTTTFGLDDLVENDRLDLDIDQVGSSTAGSNLTVVLKVGPTL